MQSLLADMLVPHLNTEESTKDPRGRKSAQPCTIRALHGRIYSCLASRTRRRILLSIAIVSKWRVNGKS